MNLRNTITLVLKLLHNCNLSCEYCFYLNNKYLSSKQSSLKIENLKIILRKTAEICENVNLIFHGGEPLLLPVNYYEEVMAIQNKLSEQFSVKFTNYVQSNGTILNDSIISLLKTHSIEYGVSLDGPKEVHDSFRHFRNSTESTFDTIIKNVQTLNSLGLKISSLVVANKSTVSNTRALYDFFKKNRIDFKISEMFFKENDKYYIPSNDELASFYIELFDLWFHDKSEGTISIDPFTNIISSFWGENAGDCCYKSSCSSFFLVETDGSITLCSRLKFLNHRLGNLLVNSWEEILKSKVLKDLNQRILKPNDECGSCRWLKACGCGCTASGFETYGDMYQKTYWCDARKKLFSHIYNKLQSLN